jgi:hypothetical protein
LILQLELDLVASDLNVLSVTFGSWSSLSKRACAIITAV